ncbi:hypothetical protein [Agrobacterium rubi]|uniref:hypothetical protein n=1 Tax=Agrobacterium rubi TaxID=28099 RepID=UPI0015721FD1|nr:hypothetical protein [Agrobacterium rubi]NTE87222.1 hypothetical protein [Agrobacterium rubi]NTF03156.1 hypothetical protein [Agrobacterium rubi]
MNCIAAYPVPVPGGYRAMVRLSHKAQPWPLMNGEAPTIYPTFDAAKIAAMEHVIKHINGTMRRDGAILEARSKADALFNLNPTIKQRGKQRPITVERREKRV